MEIVKIECPGCGGHIDMDASREFGFCIYCGTKIYIPNAVQRIRGVVTIDNSGTIDNIIKRARQLEEQVDLRKAKEYYERVLSLDILNTAAEDGLRRINHSVVFENKMDVDVNFVIDRKSGILRAHQRCAIEFENGYHTIVRRYSRTSATESWRVNIGAKPLCYEIVIEPTAKGPVSVVSEY